MIVERNVLAVTGAANDEPFANRVTDVPIDAICTQVEHDVLTTVGHPDPPRPLHPSMGFGDVEEGVVVQAETRATEPVR